MMISLIRKDLKDILKQLVLGIVSGSVCGLAMGNVSGKESELQHVLTVRVQW